jgi:hypothetical protein
MHINVEERLKVVTLALNAWESHQHTFALKTIPTVLLSAFTDFEVGLLSLAELLVTDIRYCKPCSVSSGRSPIFGPLLHTCEQARHRGIEVPAVRYCPLVDHSLHNRFTPLDFGAD